MGLHSLNHAVAENRDKAYQVFESSDADKSSATYASASPAAPKTNQLS